MKIAQKYSHLNGEEYLMVHHPRIYEEIQTVISSIDASTLRNKISKESRMVGKRLYSPKEINRAFKSLFSDRGWGESRYNYYITLNRDLMEKSIGLDAGEQKTFLEEHGETAPIFSYNQRTLLRKK